MSKQKPFIQRAFILHSLCCLMLGMASFGYAQAWVPAPPQRPNQPQAKMPTVEVLKIRVVDGAVSADISASPLQKVLQELADRTGIIFEIQSHNNPLISIHLQESSVQEAIERMIPGSSFIYEYDPEDSARITLVRILSRPASAVLQTSILSLGSGVITKVAIEIRSAEQARTVLASAADLDDRLKAVEFLVKARGQASVQALREALADTAPEIRMAAIEGLTSLKAHKMLPDILPGLKDTDSGVRQRAIAAVAALGTARNIRDLKPLTFDKNADISAAAEFAIHKLSSTVKP